MAKKSSRTTKKQTTKRGLFWRFCKLCLILGLWAGIALGIYIAYIASELPEITANVKFERSRSLTFLAQDGTKIAHVGELKGETVTAEDLPPHLIHALLATEDRRFYDHFGIDPLGIGRAMVTNIMHGRLVQGGSTITQQLAKNLFLTPERTYKRKLQEAILAIWLETQLSKDEILSAYLNRVYFGSGAYGVQAASDLYFGKNVRTLNLKESAMLVGLLKAPSRYSPLNNPDLARERMGTVMIAIEDAGYDYDTDQGQITIAGGEVDDARQVHYFTDWLMDEVNQHSGAIEGDLIIETTLDPRLQDEATAALRSVLNQSGDARNISQGAIVLLQNNGAVRAMVGGRDYGESQFNRATQAVRAPGSSFKPFVYLTALARGFSPNDMITDAPITQGSYQPANFAGDYMGPVRLGDALTNSLNTATVRLAEEVGIGYVIGTARKLGITSDLERNLSLALGSSGVSLIEMVSAYTVFPNAGQRPEPFAILTIRDEEGNIYYQHGRARALPRLFPQTAVIQTAKMMENVVNNGTGRNARIDRPAAGKTGTSQDYRDGWFIGFTSAYTAGVWLGNDDNSPMSNVTGGSFPARIWADVMADTPAQGQPTWRRQLNAPSPRRQPEARQEDSGFTGFISRILGGEETQAPRRPQQPVEPRYNQ